MLKYLLLILTTFPLLSQTRVDWSQIKNRPDNLQDSTWLWANTSGSVSASGTLIMSIRPCPLGMATGIPVYISGGTGTAEVALVASTSCSGTTRTPGTVTVTVANAHSGAYTAFSATAGIQERWNYSDDASLGASIYHVYSSITPPTGAKLSGVGSAFYSAGGTQISFHSLNTKLFNVIHDNFHMKDIALVQVGTAVAGNMGIFVAGSSSGVPAAAANWGEIYNVTLDGFYHGVYNAGSGGSFDLTRVGANNSRSTGFVSLGGQGNWTRITVQFSGMNQSTPTTLASGHGVYLAPCTSPPCGTNPWISGLQTFSNYGWGLYGNNVGLNISGTLSYLNNDRMGEIHCLCSGEVSNVTIQNSGMPAVSTGFSEVSTAPGVEIASGSSNFTLSNAFINHNNGNCIYSEVSSKVVNVDSFDCGVGGVSNNNYSIKSTGANASIINHYAFTDPVYVSGNNTRLVDNAFYGGKLTQAALEVGASTIGLIVDRNVMVNSNGGDAFKCPSSSSLIDGVNSLAGTIANTCTRYATSTANTAVSLFIKTFSTLGSASAVAAGTQVWCGDCTIGASCTGTGSGAIGVSNGTSWICK